ncbi:MAG TPA: VOC family protein [Acidobacteriota bacterium]|nr:VOC family protein [Acidobacteriota bacterium]HMZ81400.1 VOC family protein [Acidobacteriota bacterium]HNB71143.1 VOC family protein [Acidobacteriota bacterium]HND19546.1 VOC family protein [Acidobacteriota bacterium]HNG92412.1 VOC family protein [Acidobacteriota bacterium]
MSETPQIELGKIGWIDLTIEDADGVRDFYKSVVGWETSDISMGDYNDYCMHPPGSAPVAGVCHARGTNVGLPAQWLIYITVADLEQSIARCVELGGAVLVAPKSAGEHGKYCVIRDPAGAVCGLFQKVG